MIRTKAKNLLLGIMLAVASLVFFACKEQTKIGVEKIVFTEQNISLLVGEEYTPTIKVLPSYATIRSYKLVAEDVTALEINGGTIKALKPAMDVKLKVISDDNENANDVISVNIYSEAVELDAPSELNFDGTEFTFVGVDNVNSYILNVDGVDINIGNNTEYDFSLLEGKISDLYNNIITCKVKAVGDGKVFKNSNYSDAISFVKLSGVDNAYVDGSNLYFDISEGVVTYDIDVIKNGNTIKQIIADQTNVLNDQVVVDISSLIDSENGAEYTLKINSNTEGYVGVDAKYIFLGNATELNYNVLGSVKNVNIVNRTISWDFVKNAESYTIELYKNNEFQQSYKDIVNNYFQVDYVEAGEYYCKILANSTKPNTTTGKIYSDSLDFEILNAPTIIADNNTISWDIVDGAEGYLITIKDSNGLIVNNINNKFVITNSYDVSKFGAGTYYIEAIACGNNQNIITSQGSVATNWTILQDLQLSVENKILCWQDSDINSLNKYRISFELEDKVLTSADYDVINGKYCYNLSKYDFEPKEYNITVQSLGGGNKFDAGINNISIIKLPEGSFNVDNPLYNKQFIINKVNNAVSYKVEVYNSSDLNTPIQTLDTIIEGNKFNLNADVLDAGNYVAKVFVYGNGATIFDADNLDFGTIVDFEKLAIPTMDIDYENFKIVLNKDVETNAKSYKIFENSKQKTVSNNEYSLSGLKVGDYSYTAQAIGDGKRILDSKITINENAKNVKKLATPTITFDKENLTFGLACTDEDFVDTNKNYIGEYVFTLNEDKVITVANNVANCVDDIKDFGVYQAKVYVNPQSATSGYNGFDLVIASNTSTYSVSKLNGLCNFQITNGNLIVTPAETMNSNGYSLVLRIENGSNDIVLDDFVQNGSYFQTSLYDANYNVREELSSIMSTAGEYEIYTIISKNAENVVTSDDVKSVNSETTEPYMLKVLNKVGTIVKNEQNIAFNIVENATNYKAVITLNGQETYIDIADNYTVDTTNVITMQNLLALMKNKGISYVENQEYSIKFISLNNDNKTLPNKGAVAYNFAFLKAPILTITEVITANDNIKYLNVANNDSNSLKYNMIISQGMVLSSGELEKTAGQTVTLVNMDAKTEIPAGSIKILIKALANPSDNYYFDSQNAELNVIKLDSSLITIENGLLTWNKINNSKQYNLIYTNAENENLNTLVLTETSDNFTISGNKCIYDFKSINPGKTTYYLQVDSILDVNGVYYLNSNNGQIIEDVYKLSPIEINVVSGQIYTEIRKNESDYIGNIEIKVNDKVIDIDIRQTQTGVSIKETTDKYCITIMPDLLFTYGETELLLEKLSLQAYANANAIALNSTIQSKDIYGLLKPTNLDIVTSKVKNDKDVVTEVLEKITWTNPAANRDYVSKYQVVINYNEIGYSFTTNEPFLMMPTYYDSNNNGKFDDGEKEFGAGVYVITVKSLTDNSVQYVNSTYCNPISVTVLETPEKPSVEDGNIIWTQDKNAGYYLVKVYLLDQSETTPILSTQVNVGSIDLTTLMPMQKGIYGVSVQAMHDNLKILASKESEVVKVVRLPEVDTYYIDDGEFFLKIHRFFTKAEVYIINSNNQVEDTLIFENPTMDYEIFVENYGFDNVVVTYDYDLAYVDVKYQIEDDTTLRKLLSSTYSVKVKMFGNTGVDYGIVSGMTSTPINNYYAKAGNDVNKNVFEKLITPEVKVSSTERGVVLINTPSDITYSLKYYINDNKSLQGVHLYEVNISASKPHTMYVANVVNTELLTASLTAGVNSGATGFTNLISASDDVNGIANFTYNGITFNVIYTNAEGYMPFNFNTENTKYLYYDKLGACQEIDLSEGGSFVFDARFIGDDSRFVNSNVSTSIEVQRYDVINLVINNGELSWINQATLIEDNPIYIVELTNSKTSEKYNLVLYNESYHSKDEIIDCLDSGKSYIFDTISYFATEEVKDEVITYSGLADIINAERIKLGIETDSSNSTFLANVSAHFTDNTSMDIILAQSGGNKTIAILPQSQINIVDGDLSWKLSSIDNKPVTNYKLKIFDENGENELYSITLKEGDYSSDSSNIATYKLPQTRELDNGEGNTFRFVANTNYIFKLVALGQGSNDFVNSITTSTEKILLLPDLQDLKMQDGLLIWENETSNNVEIYISYEIKNGDEITEINLPKIVNGNSFDLPKLMTDESLTDRNMIAGRDYKIKARIKGSTNSISGFFVPLTDVVRRMDTIDVNSIVTNGGVLTWNASSIEGATYSIHYTHTYNETNESRQVVEKTETGIIDNLDAPYYDFAGFKAGVISVQVYAHHNLHFTSFTSGKYSDDTLPTLTKLNIPTNIQKHENTTIITWDAIDGADRYYISIVSGGIEIAVKQSNTNSWNIEDVDATSFGIAIKASNSNESGNILNSEYTEYIDLTLPNQVDVQTFMFDETRKAFIWKAIEGEQVGIDKYYIGFTYYNKVLQANETAEPTPINSPFEVIDTITIDGEKWYCYYPYMMGSYRSIYVQVLRAGSLASQQTWCMTGNELYGLDFALFASGDGVDNPYRIETEEHLRNIKYFLGAKYILGNDIEINYLKETTTDNGTIIEFNPITNTEQVFTGSFDGNNKIISGVLSKTEIKFDESGYVGLFSIVRGAEFKNLILTDFALNGYVKSTRATNPNTSDTAVYVGILTAYADGTSDDLSIFTNITITSSSIRVAKYKKGNDKGCITDSISLNIGTIAGAGLNSEFNNCTISLGLGASIDGEANIITEVVGNSQTKIAIGGLVGYSANSTFNNNTSNESNAFVVYNSITSIGGSLRVYVGALIGEAVNNGLEMSNNSCKYAVKGENVSKTDEIGYKK